MVGMEVIVKTCPRKKPHKKPLPLVLQQYFQTPRQVAQALTQAFEERLASLPSFSPKTRDIERCLRVLARVGYPMDRGFCIAATALEKRRKTLARSHARP